MLFRHPSLSAAAEPVLQRWLPWFSAFFYAARILQIKPQAGCLRLKLRVSRFFPLFVPGQHLALRVQLNGVAMERTFSICSPLRQLLQQRELELAVKIQPQGRFTGALPAALTPGDYVHLSAPAGEFCYQQGQPACFIAGGSGVTPLFSMLTSVSRLTAPLLFVYCYRGPSQLLFAGQWQQLQQKFPLLRLILWDTTRQGRFSADALIQLQPDWQGQFCLCGPAAMTRAFKAVCLAQGATEAQISQESYGAAFSPAAGTQPVSLLQGGQRHALIGQGTLLERAEQSGLAPRYGCRRGICMQCLCEKRSGLVRNLLTGEISAAGSEQIQLCISEAVSAVELVSEGADDNAKV